MLKVNSKFVGFILTLKYMYMYLEYLIHIELHLAQIHFY